MTARKISLGQANIFISVCYSVQGGWSTLPGTPTPQTRQLHPPDQSGTTPRPSRYTLRDQACTPPGPGTPSGTTQATPPGPGRHSPPGTGKSTSPPEKHTPAYGKHVGGTHPTLMRFVQNLRCPTCTLVEFNVRQKLHFKSFLLDLKICLGQQFKISDDSSVEKLFR